MGESHPVIAALLGLAAIRLIFSMAKLYSIGVQLGQLRDAYFIGNRQNRGNSLTSYEQLTESYDAAIRSGSMSIILLAMTWLIKVA